MFAISETRLRAFAIRPQDRHHPIMTNERKDPTGRKRYAEWQERLTRGAAILPIEVEPAALTAALTARGLLQPGEQPDRAALAEHAAAIVSLYCAEPEKD